jgi:hypothetical protein
MTDKEIKAYKARVRREADPTKHRQQVKAWKVRNRDKWLAIKRAYYQRRKARIAAGLALLDKSTNA